MKKRKLTRILSMLTAAMMPGFVSLEAAIIYSGSDQNIIYFNSNSPYNFSLFGKVAQWDDIALDVYVYGNYHITLTTEFSFGSLLDVHGNFIDFAVGDNDSDIKLFEAGMTIDGTDIFSNNNYMDFSKVLIISHRPFPYYPVHFIVNGEFRNQTGYAGIRMVDGSNTYYGWMQVSVENYDNSNITGTLIDWAYEDTPGRAIIAGETFSAPEPSGTLLAAAGIGLIMFRRRLRTTGNVKF